MLFECIYATFPLPEVAVPDGEAHRHEPPIPHDEVQIEKRKNQQELDEEKKNVPEEGDMAEQGAGQQQDVTQDRVNEVNIKKHDIAKIPAAEDLANEILGKVKEQKQPVVVVHKSEEQPPLVKEPEAEDRLPADKNLEESDKNAAEFEARKREYLYLTVHDVLIRGVNKKCMWLV